MNWKADDVGTIRGSDGTWRVIAVNWDGDLAVVHEPTGQTDTVPAEWLQPSPSDGSMHETS